MVKISAEAHVALHPAEYWEIRNTPEFLAIECEFLNNACKYISEEQLCAQGKRQSQVVITKPDLSGVPQWVLRMGPEEGITFTDHISFVNDHPDSPYVVQVRTVPSIMSDRCNINACLKVIPNEDGLTCKQTIDLELTVNVFGAGSILEQVVARGITEGYKKLPDMVEKWKTVAASENIWKMGGVNAASAQTITDGNEDWDTKSTASDDSEFFDAGDSDEPQSPEASFMEGATPQTSSMDLSRGVGESMDTLVQSDSDERDSDSEREVITAQPSVIVLDEPNATVFDLSQSDGPVTCSVAVPKFGFRSIFG